MVKNGNGMDRTISRRAECGLLVSNRSTFRRYFLVLCGLCLFWALAMGTWGESTKRYRSGELIVRYRLPVSAADLAPAPPSMGVSDTQSAVSLGDLNRRFGVRAGKALRATTAVSTLPPVSQPGMRTVSASSAPTVVETSDIWLLQIDPGADVDLAAEAFGNNPDVLFAEPNHLGALSYVPGDPLYGNSQSDLALVGMEDAWSEQSGANLSIVVAVIDSGIDYKHPELIDAVDLKTSYNFVEDTTAVYDDLGHGTRVAGIIGAKANNGEGFAGVAFGCRMLSLDVVTSNGLITTSDVVSAVLWAMQEGVDVINLSLRFEEENKILEEVCRLAWEAGIVLVAAAGNENEGDAPVYPASYDSVIGVAAVMDDGVMRAPFSNYNGLEDSIVELAAPGATVFSTVPGSQYDGVFGSGTSFAAPVVSGVVGLLRAKYPGQSAPALRAHLRRTANPLGQWAGYGLLNAGLALSREIDPEIGIQGVMVDDSPAYDGNNDGDGALDPGERVKLILTLLSELADASSVTATVSTMSSAMTVVGKASGYFGDLYSGVEASNDADPIGLLAIAPGTGAQTIPFSVRVTDGNYYGVDLAFSLAIEDEMQVSGAMNNTTFESNVIYHVTDDLNLGGQSTIEPGSSFKVDPNVQIRLLSGASLSAVGTAVNPILFTSAKPYGFSGFGTPISAAEFSGGPKTENITLTSYDALRFVDASRGSDLTTAGLSQTPWASVAYALSQITDASTTKTYAILVAKGTYKGTPVVMKPYVDLLGGYSSPRWTRNLVKNLTTLDGESRPGRVVEGAAHTRLDGFRIRGGNVSGNGGGVVVVGSMILSNCLIRDNAATGDGGGVYCARSISLLRDNEVSHNTAFNGAGIACAPSVQVVVAGNSVHDNRTALNGSGGGLFVDGASVGVSQNLFELNVATFGAAIACRSAVNAQISNNIVKRNTSDQLNSVGAGGGVFAEQSILTLTSNTIAENWAFKGGGLYVSAGTGTVEGNIITDNVGKNGAGIFTLNGSPYIALNVIVANHSSSRWPKASGAGILCEQGSPEIEGNWICGNSSGLGGSGSDVGGGGIACKNASPIIKGNLIEGNTGRDGGGILCGGNASSEVVNNTIVRNHSVNGGGLYSEGNANPVLVNNTIEGNDATIGGGGVVAESGSVIRVINTVLWGNTPDQIVAPDGQVGTSDVMGGWVGAGAGNINADPDLTGPIAWGTVQEMEFSQELYQTRLKISGAALSVNTLVSRAILVGSITYVVKSNSGNSIQVFGDVTQGNTVATPVQWDVRDYHLLPTSPCRGAGLGPNASPLVPIVDLDGDTRAGSTADMGMDEVNPNKPGTFSAWGAFFVDAGTTLATFENCIFEGGQGMMGEAVNINVRDCVFRSNTGDGLRLTAGSSAVVGVLAQTNLGAGIVAPGHTLETCEASYNNGNGLDGGLVTNCKALSNGGDGILALAANDSNSNFNGGNGYVLQGTGDNLKANENVGTGIWLPALGNVFYSVSTRNGGHGIVLNGNGSVAECTASYNQGDGIRTAGLVVSGATVRHNKSRGIVGSGANLSVNSSRVANNDGVGVVGAKSLLSSTIVSNTGGVNGAESVETSYVGQNRVYGILGPKPDGVTVRDSTVVANLGTGIEKIKIVSNSWIMANRGIGILSDRTGQVTSCTVMGNIGAGLHSIPFVFHCNIFGNNQGGYEAIASDGTMGSGVYEYADNFWGTNNIAELEGSEVSGWNMRFILDAHDSWGNIYLNLWGVPFVVESRWENSPTADTPAFLLQAFPGRDKDYNVGMTTFTLIFSKPMDVAVQPMVTFGQEFPYTNRVVRASPGWVNNTTWQGFYPIQSDTGDGVNTIRVADARSTLGFWLPPETSFDFVIDTQTIGNPSANNGLASSLGGGMLRLQWDNGGLPPGSQGFNVQRSLTGDPGSYVKVNDAIIPPTNMGVLGLRALVGDTIIWDDTSDLAPNTLYIYIVNAVDAGGNSFQWTPPFFAVTSDFALEQAEVANLPAEGVTDSQATLRGEVIETGGEDPVVEIFFGTTDGGTDPFAWDDVEVLGSLPQGVLATLVSDLEPDTYYYYRCFAQNANGIVWAAQAELFRTDAVVQPPVVANAPASSVDSSSALLNGEVIDSGGEPVKAHICWGTVDAGTVASGWENDASLGEKSAGVFTTHTARLAPFSTYFSRAYARNSAGLVWADGVETFQTQAALPAVANRTPTAVTTASATIGFELLDTGGDTTNVTVYFGTSDGGTNPLGWDEASDMGPRLAGPVVVQKAGLVPGTTYYYRAYAENSTGGVWASVSVSFVTLLNLMPPLVENVDATEITTDSAVVGGNLTRSGGVNPSVTIYWGMADGGTDTEAWTQKVDLGTLGEGAFSATLALEPEITCYYRAYAINSAGEAWAAQTKDFTTRKYVTHPTVINLPAGDVGVDSASLGAAILDAGGEPTTLTLFWGAADGETVPEAWGNRIDFGAREAGEFTTLTLGLSAGSIYYFRARAANSVGVVWATTTDTFQTFVSIVTPTITNVSAIAVTGESALAGGSVVSTGGMNPTVTLYWGTTDGGTNPLAWDSEVDLGARGVGSFTSLLSALTPATMYYYRYYASNIAGAAWAASTVVFNTNSGAPLIGNPLLHSRSATTVSLGVEVISTGGEEPSVTFFWGTIDGGDVAVNWQNLSQLGSLNMGKISTSLGGLQSMTTYYFRARASNSGGESWTSPTLVFTTLPFSAVVTNLPATGITTDSVTLNGAVLGTGGENPTVRLYWGATDGGKSSGAWANVEELGPLGIGVFQATLSGLSDASIYYYRALATNGAGDVWAAETTSFTMEAIYLPPPGVTMSPEVAVDATSATLSGQVADAFSGDPTVHVYWGLSDEGDQPGAWGHDEDLGVLGAGTFSVPLTGLVDGTTYFFRCFAENAGGAVWTSPSLTFTTVKIPDALDAPGAVVATDGTMADRVQVGWSAVPFATHYRLYRGAIETGQKVAQTPWQTELTFDDADVEEGVTYFYWVRAAFDATGARASDYSAPDSGWASFFVTDGLSDYLVKATNCTVEINAAKSVFITGANDKSSVKISLLKKAPKSLKANQVLLSECGVIPLLSVDGNLKKFYTNAPIKKLVSQGTVKSFTAKDASVEWISAVGLSKVKIAVAPDSTSAENPKMEYISIFLSGPSSFAPKVLLTGAILHTLDAPGQDVAAIKVLSKKRKNKVTGAAFASYSGIDGGAVRAREIKSVSAKGAWVKPSELVASFSLKPMKVSASSGLFKVGVKGAKLLVMIPGDVGGSFLTAGPDLRISVVGGNILCDMVIAPGYISKLSAREKKVKLGGTTEYLGGYLGTGISGGLTSYSLFVSGSDSVAARKDIKSVYGSFGVRGVFMAGATVDLDAPTPVTASLAGAIGTIATKKPGSVPATPQIVGEGWSISPIKFKGDKQHLDFLEHNQ